MRLRRCALAAIVALLLLSGGFIRPAATRAIGLWIPAAPLPAPFDASSREYVSASLLRDGDVLVISNATFSSDARSAGQAVRYNPTTDSWSPASSMTTARYGFAAAPLPSGQLLVVGGSSHLNGKYVPSLATAERYDPTTNRWLPTASLHTPRESATATPLFDGRVLVVGGTPDTKLYDPTAELYDPATDTWTMTGSLSIGRRGHTATRLLDGRVLVVGGGVESHTS